MAFALNFWKTHYGFPAPDESFYVTMFQRFYLGDVPVIHEWNPTQFPAILPVPFYGLFMKINGGSTEGVILYFRILYVLMVQAGGMFIYRKTRQYGWGAVVISCIYLLYTFGHIQTVHYDTIGLFSSAVFSILLIWPGKHRNISYFLAGLFFAFAVLCTPYLALFYFLFTIALPVLAIRKYRHITPLFRGWLAFTCGGALAAAAVTGYILRNTTVSAFIEHFPLMFSSTDATYASEGGIVYDTVKSLYYGWLFSDATTVYLPIHLLFVLLLGFGRQRVPFLKKYAFALLVVSHTVLTVCYWKAGRDFSMLAFILLGVIPLLFDRQPDRKAAMLWLIGIVYSWSADMTSDTLLSVLSSAATICALGSVLMVTSYVSRMEDTKIRKASAAAVCLLSIVFLSMEVFDKLNYTYQDTSPLAMDGLMERGPAKGIHTRADYAQAYDTILSDIDELGLKDRGENVLLWSNRSWIILYLNGKCANYSTWFKPFSKHFVKTVPDYYERHPEKLPDVVYMPKNEVIPYVMEKGQLGDQNDLQKLLEPYGMTLHESEYSYSCAP